MQVPLHPLVVHLPVALTLILPVLILVFALLIKSKKMPPQLWIIIVGLQLTTTVSGYFALETGETDEALVKKVVDKKLIHHHEEAAEIFVGSTVLILVVSIAVIFLNYRFIFPIHLLIAFMSLVSCYLVYNTGISGGELVYRYGAGAAHTIETSLPEEGLLPTPGLNTSESEMPLEQSDSLKVDENDYDNGEKIEEE